MTIKIAVTWSCGHTDEFTTDKLEIPDNWHTPVDYSEPDPDVLCPNSLSKRTREAIR